MSNVIIDSEATDQLLQVVLDPRQVGERTDGHQAAQSKVKQLVAEERDEPAVAMLNQMREKRQFQPFQSATGNVSVVHCKSQKVLLFLQSTKR